MSGKKIILTGFTPSSGLHIGNYIGAIKPVVELQKESSDKDLYVFISDLHALTNPAVDLKKIDKEDFLCTFIASGIDLSKTKVFYQSDVPAHTQLG
jgi:tryptophanyl-tRNA synthetase